MTKENLSRRSLIKTLSTNGKEKLRRNCLNRIREDRVQLLWKIRLSGKPEHKKLMESTFHGIVCDELEKIKQSCMGTNEVFPSETDDLLWEYDELQPVSQSSTDWEELMLEMERSLYEDIHEERMRRALEVYEKSLEEEDNYLAQAVFERMQLNDNQDEKVWCPICKRGELREKHHFIYCTCCELQLDVQSDKVNLDFLRTRLGEVHMEHLDRGCNATPKFCMDTSFDINALYIQCEVCDIFEIVM